MEQNIVSRRAALAVEFLRYLKQMKEDASATALKIEDDSNTYVNTYIENNKTQVIDDVIKYRSNIAEIQKLKGQLTEKMNAWYLFVKTPSALASPFFPLKFFAQKRKLRQDLTKISINIEKTTLENRFICESIYEWENKKREEAIEKLKDEEIYKNFRKLMRKKSELTGELSNILPSIPGICPISYDFEDIDRLISRLEAADLLN